MRVLHVGIGEIVSFDDHIRLSLTGWVDGTWYVYIEAHQDNALGDVDGFRASAPCGFGWRAHVLALFDGDAFEIGPVRVRIGDAREDAGIARALRDAQFEIDAPEAMRIARTQGARLSRYQRKG